MLSTLHDFLEGFGLMMVVDWFLYGTYLHGGLYDLQWLQDSSAYQAACSPVQEASEDVALLRVIKLPCFNWF